MMNMLKKQMKKMSGVCCLAMAMGFALNAAAAPAITNVKAQQRYPWNGKFDISYTATGVDEECWANRKSASLMVYAVERTTHVTNVAKAVYLSGDTTMTNGTHKLVWDMDAQGVFQGVVSTNFEVFVSAEVTIGGVQLWKDGPYWDACNVGASKPEEAGYYFSWGEDARKRNETNDGWVSLVFEGSCPFDSSHCQSYGRTIEQLTSAGYIDSTGNLAGDSDGASYNLGAPWRMPTSAELQALIDNCTFEWLDDNYSVRVTGKGDYASKSIILPAGGCGYGDSFLSAREDCLYWSSTPSSANANRYAYCFLFSDGWGICEVNDANYRTYGFNVRAVRTSSK